MPNHQKPNYPKRREALLESLPKGSALIIASSPLSIRSGDVHYPYRPHSDMIYFSGWEEESAALIFSRTLEGEKKQMLFVQDKNPAKELWTGPVHGPEDAAELTQISDCHAAGRFLDIIKEELKHIHSIYYSFHPFSEWNQEIHKWIQDLKKPFRPSLHDSIQLTAPLRAQKDEYEIKTIKQAAHIAALAHKELVQNTRPGLNEQDLLNIFHTSIKKQGAGGEAYPGIFAGGPNSCILHYTKNTSSLKSGDLILIDAGAEYQYYASDISRTFPINGRFNKTQKRIYNKILGAQKTLIQNLKPGVSFVQIQNQANSLLSEILIEEKILSGSLKEVLKTKSYKKYFPHNFGHSMGLDVHDVVFQNTPLTLPPGFVLTIEPGLYFPPGDDSLPHEFKGLGIRIEDDILITPTGAEVLSYEAPKEAGELEELFFSK